MKNLVLVLAVVDYFNTTPGATCRSTGKHFGISKTTVHNYLTKINPNVTSRIKLDINKKEAPKRGGMATKRKYEKMRS